MTPMQVVEYSGAIGISIVLIGGPILTAGWLFCSYLKGEGPFKKR